MTPEQLVAVAVVAIPATITAIGAIIVGLLMTPFIGDQPVDTLMACGGY